MVHRCSCQRLCGNKKPLSHHCDGEGEGVAAGQSRWNGTWSAGHTDSSVSVIGASSLLLFGNRSMSRFPLHSVCYWGRHPEFGDHGAFASPFHVKLRTGCCTSCSLVSSASCLSSCVDTIICSIIGSSIEQGVSVLAEQPWQA